MGGLASKIPTTYRTFLVATLTIAGRAVPRGLLLEGRDQGGRLPRRVRGGALAAEGPVRGRPLHGGPDRVLHVPPPRADLLGQVPRDARAGGAHPRVAGVDDGAARRARRSSRSCRATSAIPIVEGGNRIGEFLKPIRLPIEGLHEKAHHAPLSVELALMGAAVAVAAVGIYLAWSWYVKGEGRVPARLAAEWPGVYRAVSNKYFVDEAYEKVFVAGPGPGRRPRVLWEVDATVVDLIPNGARGRHEGLLLDRLDLRPVRRRRPRQRRREHPAGPLPRLPPRPDRPRAELRAASWAEGSSVSWPCTCCFDETIRGRRMNSDAHPDPLDHHLHPAPRGAGDRLPDPQGEDGRSSRPSRPSSPPSTSSSRCRSGGPSTAASDGYQFVEKASWIPSLGVSYHFGIDGISLVLILLTTLMGVIAVVLLVLGDHGPAEGVLRPPPAAPDLHDRDVLLSRPLPLLRVLGSDAGPDVLPDRRLGRPAAALRGDQVLPVHAGGLGADAARHHRPLLLQHDRVPRVQGPRQRGRPSRSRR